MPSVLSLNKIFKTLHSFPKTTESCKLEHLFLQRPKIVARFKTCSFVYIVVCFVCFCLILCIMYSCCYVYVFLLLCMFSSMYYVSLCCSVYCFCVNVFCTTGTGCQPNSSKQIYRVFHDFRA